MILHRECNIWTLGGDQRQLQLARLLAADSHTVHIYALDTPESEDSLHQIKRADCIIFPLPVSDDSNNLNAPLSRGTCALSAILSQLSPSQFLCGGRVTPAVQELCETFHLHMHDYFAQEELIVSNAIPTAEGAIQIAMEQLPITIHGSRVLVLGFGRVGRITAQRFAALGAKVSVAARNYAQLALARSMDLGTEHLSHLTGWMCSYDLIINTIPAPVLNREQLEDVKADCLILDLASQPGGVDRSAAHALGISVIHALGLPGKVAPVTAGAAIQRTIYHMLTDAGF